MPEQPWSYEFLRESDGTLRVEVIDEDRVRFPIGRQLDESQARLLIQRVAAEAGQSRQPIKTVIRDPRFMSATILSIKRQPV